MIKFRCYLYLRTLPSLLLTFIERKWGFIIFSYLSRLMFLLRVQLFSDYGRTTHHKFPNKTVHFYCQRIKTKLNEHIMRLSV